MNAFLTAFEEFMKTQPFRVIRLSEMKPGGEISTFEMTEANFCQNVYSVAKTFTMTAIGLLWDRGALSLDEKIVSILGDEIAPEVREKMDPRWEDSTVEMALTHRLGFPGGFLDIDVTPSSVFGADYLGYALAHPLAYAPGTGAKYSDGAFYVLSRIAGKKAGEPMDAFLWRELFYPLGFQEMAWSKCPAGHPMGATGLYVHSSDMVKLGALYLAGGVWNGRRILSENWVRLAEERGFALDWDGEHRICFKGGMYGQKLIFSPEQNRAVAVQAYGGNSDAVAEWVRDEGAKY